MATPSYLIDEPTENISLSFLEQDYFILIVKLNC